MEYTPVDKKLALRSHYRKVRLNIPNDQRQLWDEKIYQSVITHPALLSSKTVFLYLSLPGEVSTEGIVKYLLDSNKRVLTPSTDIKALPHDGLFRVDLHKDTGLTAPTLCTESLIEHIDLVLVPGIVWDREGFRIGFGGGYFDRVLAMTRPDCQTIGLAYECQLTDSVPREPWDKKVNTLITETTSYIT